MRPTSEDHNMKTTSIDLFKTSGNWKIVHADLDLAHVFLPITDFSLVPDQDANKIDGYRLHYSCQTPNPDCFAETFFVAKGQSTPSFEQVISANPEVADLLQDSILPKFGNDEAAAQLYAQVAKAMDSYMERDRDVQRLEGVIRVPCHAHGAEVDAKFVQGHSPLWIRTLVEVYQFPEAINGDAPLLVIRAPLSPVCPLNNDGTALGVNR